MVWIHGGAYSTGSSAVPLYRGERLVSMGDVVLVTINYRLGALGYLDFTRYATPQRPIDSNLGPRDQVLALSWVRDNIAAFGGDRSQVTIFGESAGGNAVTTLMATPAAQGLFARAIAESPAPTSVYDAAQTAHWAGTYARLLGVDPEDTAAVVSRLTAATPDELVAATSTLSAAVPDQMPGSIALCPVVDGDYLPRHPVEAFIDGSAARVPLLLGTNAREGTLFTRIPALDILPTTERRIERMFQLTDPAARARVLAAYPGYPDKSTLAQFGGDLAFLFPSLAVVEAHTLHAPTWLYRFDSSTRLLDLLGVGATHATELPLVFGEVSVGLEPLQTPVRRAVAAASAALAGDPELVTAEGERGVAALAWQAGDEELDAALAEIRAVEASAAGVRLALVREARRRGLQHRTGAPDIACWLADRYGLDGPAAMAEADLAAAAAGPGAVGEQTGVALAAGLIGERRAQLVLGCLDRLPTGLTEEVVAEAQRLLLEGRPTP